MKKNSIETALPRLARRLIVILILLILPANIGLQQYIEHQNQRESSEEVFAQLEQLIELNEKNLENEKNNFSEKCIQAAEMAAYFAKYSPSVKSDLEEVRMLAEKLDIDEIHFFTEDGRIYFGTHPEYYGYTFESGEQMSFFLPMLEDHSLKLCQEITPNTAEGKEMQYAAVWSDDGREIVQIGVEPVRVLQEIDDSRLENIVSAIPMDLRGYLHIMDRNTGMITASTGKLTGKVFKDGIGYDQEEAIKEYHSWFHGERYCVYSKIYKNYQLIRTYYSAYPLQNSILSTAFVLLYMLLAATAVIGAIVWYVNKNLSKNLTSIVNDLKKIEQGNLDNITINTNIKEFDELILYINALLKSIRLNWNKMSHVVDKGSLPIGIFEDNRFYKKTFVNERMLELLNIGNKEERSSEALFELVRKKMRKVEENCVNSEEQIYKYSEDGEEKSLRIEKFSDDQSDIYYVTDVSLWCSEISVLKEQSSRDSLTGLYNRRGLSERMEELFAVPENLGYGAFIMLDADGLKRINDVYGHLAGDEYLSRIGKLLSSVSGENSVCARLGGDEFAIFLYGYATTADIQNRIHILKARRGERFVSETLGAEISVEFSVGYAFYPADGSDYHFLMHLADEHMYQEKKQRKEEKR